jgi:tetratricopeptide (TPR) repeat protein
MILAVRWGLNAALACLLATAALTRAQAQAPTARQQADALVREGKAAADAGRLLDAITAFHRAEALLPRAIHDCNIGLAYARLERWPQALLFLESCRARTTEGLRDWVPPRIAEAERKLAAGSFAPIEVTATPAGARVTASSLDETFTAPRRVWLPFGETHLTASAAGYVDEKRTVAITSRAPQTIDLALHPPPVATVEPPATAARPAETTATRPVETTAAPPATPPVRDAAAAPEAGRVATRPIAWSDVVIKVDAERARRNSFLRAGITLLVGGVAQLIVGLGLHLHAVLSIKPAAEQLPPGDAFNAQLDKFRGERDAAIASYVVGSAAAVTGVALLATVRFGARPRTRASR